MIDESIKAMIEYAIKEYRENKRYSLVHLNGFGVDRDVHQISRFELVDGKFLLHKTAKQDVLYPLSIVEKIIFPGE